MSQFETSYPNIDNPEGLLGIPDVVVKKTTFIQPVSGVDPQNPEDYVTKKYYEENIPEVVIPAVEVQMPIGGIIMWSGSIATIPQKWALCDGTNGTPDLRNRFIVGAGTDTLNVWGFNATTGTETFTASQTSVGVGSTGGKIAHQLTIAELAAHTHTGAAQWPGGGPEQNQSGGAEDRTTFNINSGSTGGDNYHENRPPYYALAYIMKIT